MGHKRIHVRVPIIGEAILTNGRNIQIKAQTIDISQGGLRVINPLDSLEQADYLIEVTTAEGKYIRFTATLIRKDKQNAAFKTTDIDNENLQIVAGLVAEFQKTEGFIRQIDEHDLLQQRFIDDEGNEVSVTFDVDLEK